MILWAPRNCPQEVLKESRAEYGEGIVSTLSRQLQLEYGRGFTAKNLRHMILFAEVFADEAIVSTLWRQLSWVTSGTSYKYPQISPDVAASDCITVRLSMQPTLNRPNLPKRTTRPVA
jgi:hypothetical protein